MKLNDLCLVLLALACSRHIPASQQPPPSASEKAPAKSVREKAPAESAREKASAETERGAPVPPAGSRIRINFERAAVGTLPAGWSAAKTGAGTEIKWAIAADGNNKVLAQLAKGNPNNHFNVVTLDTIRVSNVHLAARFKAISGSMDQGGGFVWRYRDARNYYIARANPLENNVVLYKVENGKRTHLPLVGKGKTYGAAVRVPAKTWNNLGVRVRGDLFTVTLNGMELFQVKDGTFTRAGKVGFWTKSDAVTYFDDLEINVLP